MSGIAQVLVTLGYKVSGSDLRKSPVTDKLKKSGADIFIGHTDKNIRNAHVVVISSAVKSDNPEVVAARKLGVPVVPRAEMLAELMRLKYGIAIAGTHGKTTTTSLVATILASAGLDPTMVVGGILNGFKTNAKLGKGEYLVAEADESDRSFLKLTPTIAVITNIDPEHMESYRDFDHVKETYLSFANKVPFYGCIVACADHKDVRSILQKIERRVVTYGLTNADFAAQNISQSEGFLQFTAVYHGKALGRVRLAIPGRHNVLNALASIAVAHELEIPFAKIRKGLAAFKGIERRFQILSKKKEKAMFVTDYAHHPKEIEAIFQATKEGWNKRRVFCVMQPHRFTRLASLFNEFVDILSTADLLTIMPVYAAGERPVNGCNSETLFNALLAKRKEKGPTFYARNKDEMFTLVRENLKEDDIVLFLGAGDISKMAKEFVKTVNSKQ